LINILAWLSLASGTFCLLLSAIVFMLDRKSIVNKLFLVGSFALFFYTFTTVMMWLSQNVSEASLWNKMGSMWPFFVVLIANFALAFTKSVWLKNKLTYVALYLPAVLFFAVDLSTNLINEPPVLRYWGYNDVASGTWIYYISTIWSAVLTVGAFLICALYYFRLEDSEKKNQTAFVSIGLAVPIVAFVITNLINRSIGIETPNLGPVTSFVLTGFVSYALLKYDLFAFDGALAAENIISTMPDALVLTDMHGKMIKTNEHLLDFLGYNENDLVGKPIEKLESEKDRDLWLNAFKKLKENKTVEGKELTCKTKTGGDKVVLFSGTVLQTRMGHDIGLACLFHDFTERKTVQEAIEKSEEKFKKTFALSPLGISIFNLSTNKFVDCNESFERLTGYQKEEIVGKHSFEINFWKHQVEREQIVIELMKEGFSKINGLELTTKSGDTKIVDACFVTVDINGEPHSISNLLDITERRKAENELKEGHLQMENLNEKLRVLGSLTRHDVRNKLMIMNNSLYILRKRLADSPELLKYLESMELAVKQSNNLLELGQIYEKIGSEKLSRISVEESFTQAASLVNTMNLNVINSCQGLNVIADSMLKQLFYNLIDNSIKHGKTVTEIKLWFETESSEIKLYYEDNGVGISKENKLLIFSEGFTTGGTGLGLKLVKKMIESYGWSITENGEPGKGARFQITLPKSALFY